jgi:hypothetical protein
MSPYDSLHTEEARRSNMELLDAYRTDDWVVHFFRDRPHEVDWPVSRIHAYWDFPSKATAFDVMRCSLLLGGLVNDCPLAWPWLNYKGLRVAVSASENGLAKMLSLPDQKTSHEDATRYGIAFRKSEFAASGGARSRARENEQLEFAEDAYWYWRPAADYDSIRCSGWNPSQDGTDYAPGMPLWSENFRPEDIGKTYLVVSSKSEGESLQSLLTAMFCAEENVYGTYFAKRAIEATRIIVLKDVIPKMSKQNWSFDDIDEEDTLPPLTFRSAPDGFEKRVEQSFVDAEQAARIAGAAYLADHPNDRGSGGKAELFIVNAAEPVAQFLLKNRWAFLSRRPDNLLVYIDHFWPPAHSAIYAEAVLRAAADVLSESLQLEADVHVAYEF